MLTGRVNKIIPFSAVDGPGNRTVIFLQGCGFNCLYCHNPETLNFCTHCGACVPNCPTGALRLEGEKVTLAPALCGDCGQCIQSCPNFSSPKTSVMTVEQCFERISKTRNFISGITVSGGECTGQYPFLLELLKKARQLGISAYIDTNGDIDAAGMKELSLYFDKAMLDIKSFDSEEHLFLTGKPLSRVIENARFLLESEKLYEIRTVIVPGFLDNKRLDNERNVVQTAKLIAQYNPSVIYKLIKFRSAGVRNTTFQAEPTDEKMLTLKQAAQKNGCLNVTVV